jgi:hypothetical protein
VLEMITTGPGVPENQPADFRLSRTGRYVAFSARAGMDENFPGFQQSYANNQVYIWDRNIKKARLISKTAAGNPGNGDSRYVNLSGDGRYLTFTSQANDLVPVDPNLGPDVFLADLKLNTLTLISSNPGNGSSSGQFSVISDDGHTVGFQSSNGLLLPGDGNNALDVFLFSDFLPNPSHINNNPVAVNDSFERIQTQGLRIGAAAFLANDYDIDTDQLSLFAVAPLSANGSVSLVGGNIIYTPAANFTGADSFSYTITDGRGGFSTATATIGIRAATAENSGIIESLGSGTFRVSFFGIPGRTYTIQFRETLPAAWANLTTATANPLGVYAITNTPPGAQGYYRSRFP